MSTIYREICNYAITKDGTAYFLNFDYLKSDGFGYTNTLFAKGRTCTTEETFCCDEDDDFEIEGEFLPCLHDKDLMSLSKGMPSENMQIYLDVNKIPDIKFDRIISFYFKYRGLVLTDSFCNTFFSDNTIKSEDITVENYDGEVFNLWDYSEEYLSNKLHIKEII